MAPIKRLKRPAKPSFSEGRSGVKEAIIVCFFPFLVGGDAKEEVVTRTEVSEKDMDIFVQKFPMPHGNCFGSQG